MQNEEFLISLNLMGKRGLIESRAADRKTLFWLTTPVTDFVDIFERAITNKLDLVA